MFSLSRAAILKDHRTILKKVLTTWSRDKKNPESWLVMCLLSIISRSKSLIVEINNRPNSSRNFQELPALFSESFGNNNPSWKRPIAHEFNIANVKIVHESQVSLCKNGSGEQSVSDCLVVRCDSHLASSSSALKPPNKSKITTLVAVFTKDYCSWTFPKHSECFRKSRLLVPRQCEFYMWLEISVILGNSGT